MTVTDYIPMLVLLLLLQLLPSYTYQAPNSLAGGYFNYSNRGLRNRVEDAPIVDKRNNNNNNNDEDYDGPVVDKRSLSALSNLFCQGGAGGDGDGGGAADHSHEHRGQRHRGGGSTGAKHTKRDDQSLFSELSRTINRAMEGEKSGQVEQAAVAPAEDNNESAEVTSKVNEVAKRHNKMDVEHKGPKIWDQWGKWSTCTVSCGVGKITRWRHCVSGGCAAGEKEAQIKTCTMPAC